MRLIYAYIRNFRNIREQEINFDNEFLCSFSSGTLKICRNHKTHDLNTLYGESMLKNVHLIVGKTGSGKTNILQMIGMEDSYRKYGNDNSAEYLLMYHDSENEQQFYAELFNIAILPGNDKGTVREYQGNGLYKLKLKDGIVTGISDKVNDIRDRLVIVNCFDSHSFSAKPYEDTHRESIYMQHNQFARWISPYGRTNVGIAVYWIQRYLDRFPEQSVKRKAALEIKCRNFIHKTTSPIDKELLKEQYWTYADIDFEERLKQPLKKTFNNNISKKSKFLHDLLADYALYLREYLEKYSKEEIDRDIEMGVYDGEVGLSDKINPYHLPDHWGDGSTRDLVKRIVWLAKVIDRSSDVEYFPNGEGLVWQISLDIIDIYRLLKAMPEKYFTSETFSIPIVDIELGRGTPMEDLFERMTGYRPDELNLFSNELLPYQITCLSSGEYQYAKVLGAIDEYCVRLRLHTGAEENPKQPDFILLLDEPETYMHPELARCFLADMEHILRDHSRESNIQVVMTTHSPFMLSDVTSSQITRLTFDEMGECRVLPKTEKTFAGNILSIMANDFFLKFTIGEYSRRMLSEIIRLLDDKKVILEDKEWRKRIDCIKSHVGDSVIRQYFDYYLQHPLPCKK